MELVGGRRSRHVWVVRHGESTWSAEGRMQRQVAHPPLTARGTTQAYAAGYALQDKMIRRVISSNAVRATQTGQAMATVLGVEMVVDERLRERGFVTKRPVDARSAGRELLEDPTGRVRAALLDIAALPGPSAVVTHGDIVCAILDMLGPRTPSTQHWATGADVPNGVVLEVSLRKLRGLAEQA
jgi:broad specificity phosphatase PhoE